MRILVVYQHFLGKNEPGISRFNQFVRYWEEQGHEVTVVAGAVNHITGKKDNRYKNQFIYQEQFSDNVTVYRTHVSEAYNRSFLGRLWAYISFTLSSLFAILFKIKKHDVLVVTSPPLFVGITGVLAKLFKRIPLIFEVRDLWPESAIDTGVLNNKFLIKSAYIVEKLAYKFADRINVLTPAFEKTLVENKNVPKDKIAFIPNGADLDIFTPGTKQNWVREAYGLEDKFIVTYMGSHGIANNLDSILNVAKAVQTVPDIVFLLIGDGMEKERLQKRADDEGIDNALFIDSQPKHVIVDFCNASDVCTAVLQQNEVFKTVYPNKVFDYMSCAKPILLGIDGAARELVETSESGIYVDPNDPEMFKDKLMTLYNDDDLLSELGQNGYHYVKDEFNRAALAEKYTTEMKKVLV